MPAALPVIASLPNLRDVGGLATADGRMVQTGVLYRSGTLDSLSDAELADLAGLGLRAIYDLRSDHERETRPDRLPAGVRHVGLDMVADVAQLTPGLIMAALADPKAARELLGDGRGAAMFLDHYREFVTLPSASRALGRLFGDLLDEGNRPALVHCMGGKDRTGWTAASLQLLLGVPEPDVMADFLLSNDRLGPAFQVWLDDFVSIGGDPDIVRDTMWTRPEFLQASLSEMHARYGSIERYFGRGLGLGEDGVTGLRRIFLG